MKSFELLPGESKGVSVKLLASTRAGLITAAVQGLHAAQQPKVDPDSDEKIERVFSLKADDAAELLIAVLRNALEASKANKEAYDDLKLTLITDRQAEGALIGKPCGGYGRKIAAVSEKDVVVQKNELGEWETTITFQI